MVSVRGGSPGTCRVPGGCLHRGCGAARLRRIMPVTWVDAGVARRALVCRSTAFRTVPSVEYARTPLGVLGVGRCWRRIGPVGGDPSGTSRVPATSVCEDSVADVRRAVVRDQANGSPGEHRGSFDCRCLDPEGSIRTKNEGRLLGQRFRGPRVRVPRTGRLSCPNPQGRSTAWDAPRRTSVEIQTQQHRSF